MRSHHGFLGCHDCQLLSPVVASDGATQDDQEAYREFAAAHGTHHTALLSWPTSETWSDRPLWDPLATISFEVSDGARTCVVHASRQCIDEPRIYRFQPGSLTVTNVDRSHMASVSTSPNRGSLKVWG